MAARFVITLTALSIGFASPAFSQTASTPCVPLERAFEELANEWGEYPVGQHALLGVVIVRLENPQIGTFTVISINRDGVACLIDAGREHKS